MSFSGKTIAKRVAEAIRTEIYNTQQPDDEYYQALTSEPNQIIRSRLGGCGRPRASH
ncbi:unnamed protein product [Nesidiocoris tenuis]|uniref:Uncharacterized protein n=1 Tax=Nesidiocoris tenuis TaxID=355587 RepID=A0A6H5HLA5_9HEMI|nr:unnamed protein product [Nesidiocoris tenuis]